MTGRVEGVEAVYTTANNVLTDCEDTSRDQVERRKACLIRYFRCFARLSLISLVLHPLSSLYHEAGDPPT